MERAARPLKIMFKVLSVDDIIVIFLFPTNTTVARDGATHKEREIGLGLPHNGQRHLVTGKMQN